MDKPLRFHWSLSQAGDRFRRTRSTLDQPGVLDLNEQIRVCEMAEQCGIESMLMAIGFTRPDPTLLSIAIGKRTRTIKFMIACRSGLISPLYFVQQINTASQLIGGRICINIVCGHTPHELKYYGDHLSHDERYERTGEFLTVCRALWRGERDVEFQGRYLRTEHCTVDTPFLCAEGRTPEIFLGGNSEAARTLAIEHADCLWRFPAEPDKVATEIEPVARAGKETGLLVSLIARASTREAHDAASALLENFGDSARALHEEFAKRSDSTGFRSTYAMAHQPSTWMTPRLWTGAVPYLGAPSIALVGSFDDIASELMTYRQCGITQFLFIGWPDIEEIAYFGREVLPRVRRLEQSKETAFVMARGVPS